MRFRSTAAAAVLACAPFLGQAADTPANGMTAPPPTQAPTDSSAPAASLKPHEPPFHSVGKALNDAGWFPILLVGTSYVANPSMGFVTHSHQTNVFGVYGFDYYAPWSKGTSFHFTGSATRRTDTSFFGEAGDEIVASAASNLPRQDHLTRATAMQEFGEGGRYFAELGKGYANDYLARPVCNNAYLCMSVIDGTHKLAGVNFPNYSNWFLRGGYKPTENLKLQLAKWEYSTASAGFGTSENGWERWLPTYKPAYFADMQYADTKAPMPHSYELMYFYNRIPQADSITGTRANPNPTDHQSGIFASVMQTVWRPEPKGPEMLQAFAAGAYAFNNQQTQTPTTAGLRYAIDLGLMLKAPFKGRPFDSYSIQYTNVGLTADEQAFLASKGYANGSSESAVAMSANFRLLDWLFVQPYVQYVWNVQANNYASLAGLNHVVPAAPAIPTGRSGSDGFAYGFVAVIPLERAFGLSTRMSGYDGHYP